MPRLEWSRQARLDLIRLHAFLTPKSPDAAQRAVKAIKQGLKILGKYPEIGRPTHDFPAEFREWVIEFGQGAYIALYRFDGNKAVLLEIRHGRESGYEPASPHSTPNPESLIPKP